ncbi:hypothetical protein [Kriegella aquimaris]|uniref:hypothetical protein n=1 Tax=Kriegella aquimaris TaxID=192904 RepID=UPI000B7CC393|nr:hypothetical protein [Kriegella aquimaris]
MRLFYTLILFITTPSASSRKQQEPQGPFVLNTAFGPPSNVPTLSHTQISVADQSKANVLIIKALKRMNIE